MNWGYCLVGSVAAQWTVLACTLVLDQILVEVNIVPAVIFLVTSLLSMTMLAFKR